nr:hypothetical protein [Rhodospirillales bacterium]
MVFIKKYGKTSEELHADEALQCRQIIQEILDFGVSQSQIAKIAYLLALELEDREDMLSLSECAQRILNSDQQQNSGIIS